MQLIHDSPYAFDGLGNPGRLCFGQQIMYQARQGHNTVLSPNIKIGGRDSGVVVNFIFHCIGDHLIRYGAQGGPYGRET
jgi:hypothetical protein